LAAACALAESGFQVTVFERRPYLGGRASSYEHPGTGEVVDNCQHVLFKLCTNLIDFYRRIGIEDKIQWFDGMTFIEPGGRQSPLQSVSLPAPLHAFPAFMSFKFLTLRDKIGLARALRSLLTHTAQDDGTTFAAWLQRRHQTSAAIERFWKPILVSALSEDLDRISVPYAAQVIRESMKSREARLMGVPMVPLTELYNAARDYINARGGRVRFRSNVQSFLPLETGVRIQASELEEQFDYGVFAVPFDSLEKLLPNTPESQDLRDKVSHLETAPITGVHLWFDRTISNLPHAVLLDRTIQWMFHKSKLLGRKAEDGGSYLELVVSSSKGLVDKSKNEIVELAARELGEFFPAVRNARLVKSTVIKEVHATWSPAPGADRHRPPAVTAWPRVFLAGDWAATGWPATMEGAVRSGYMAAEALARAAGVRGSRFLVPDLPARGLMRLFSQG
jgi:zeta-carotene desaturase